MPAQRSIRVALCVFAGLALAPIAGPAQTPTAPAPASCVPPAPPPKLPAWFVEADTNNDAGVSRAEFTAHRIKKLAVLDADKDGLVSLEEFLKLAEPPHVDAKADLPPLARRRQILEQQFARVDVDRDGKISPEEIEAMAMIEFGTFDGNRDDRISAVEILSMVARENEERPQVPESMVLEEFIGFELRNLMRLDSNSDCRISLAEWQVMGGSNPTADIKQRLLAQFRKLDRNNDGYVDRSEAVAGITQRFRDIDKNGDQTVTRDEILAEMKDPAKTPAPVPPKPPTPPVKDGMPPGPNLPR